MYVALVCGLIGVLLRKFKVPSAAIVLGFVLGEIMEANLRRGLIISLAAIGMLHQLPSEHSVDGVVSHIHWVGAVQQLKGKKRKFEC